MIAMSCNSTSFGQAQAGSRYCLLSQGSMPVMLERLRAGELCMHSLETDDSHSWTFGVNLDQVSKLLSLHYA